MPAVPIMCCTISAMKAQSEEIFCLIRRRPCHFMSLSVSTAPPGLNSLSAPRMRFRRSPVAHAAAGTSAKSFQPEATGCARHHRCRPQARAARPGRDSAEVDDVRPRAGLSTAAAACASVSGDADSAVPTAVSAAADQMLDIFGSTITPFPLASARRSRRPVHLA